MSVKLHTLLTLQGDFLFAVINKWGRDAFRFYMLHELEIGPDGNWTDAGFKSR